MLFFLIQLEEWGGPGLNGTLCTDTYTHTLLATQLPYSGIKHFVTGTVFPVEYKKS